MVELLKKIASIPSVNGSEYALSRALAEHFLERDYLVSIDRTNNVIVQKKRVADTPKTVFFTPMDSPGFTCLYHEKGISYLTHTAAALKDRKNVDYVIGHDLKKYPTETSKYDENEICIRSVQSLLGQCFSPSSILRFENSNVCGRFAARFFCLAILIKLAEFATDQSAAFCFTSGFHSGYKSESAVLNRYQVKNAVLLGYCEKNEDRPIYCVKDGKSFTTPNLGYPLLLSCRDKEIPLCSAVFDQPVTAAERTFSQWLSGTVSLALPCQNALKSQERVNLNTANEMLRVLKCFLNLQ